MSCGRTSVALLLLAATTGADERPRQLLPGVVVSRVVIDARILDGRGRPVLGLKPEDFRVEVDGQPVALDSVDWIGSEERAGSNAAADEPVVVMPEDEGEDHPVAGRFTVFLFQ